VRLPIAVLAVIALAFGLPSAWASEPSPLRRAGGQESEIFSPIKTKLSYKRGEGRALTARVEFSSRFKECVAPNRISWGSEISPEFYAFKYPDEAEQSPPHQFKIPRVAPYTYERTLSGSTPLTVSVYDPEGVPTIRSEPLSSFQSVVLFARVEGGTITVRRNGERKQVYCSASPAHESVRTIQL
jgi:hypothetical protein